MAIINKFITMAFTTLDADWISCLIDSFRLAWTDLILSGNIILHIRGASEKFVETCDLILNHHANFYENIIVYYKILYYISFGNRVTKLNKYLSSVPFGHMVPTRRMMVKKKRVNTWTVLEGNRIIGILFYSKVHFRCDPSHKGRIQNLE